VLEYFILEVRALLVNQRGDMSLETEGAFQP